MSNMIVGLGFFYVGLPVVLPHDVYELPSRAITIPLSANGFSPEKSERLRIWASDDCGRTWKLHSELQATASRFDFIAPRDGQYWFTIQIALKDGKFDPATLDHPKEIVKVYANANRLAVIRPQVVARSSSPQSPVAQEPSLQQLRREIAELRSIVDELRKRTADLEKGRTGK
jgi:hypothetical protein